MSNEVGGLLGFNFPIFVDRSDLKWGEFWQERIDAALDEATFLFPVITPRFFRSTECRRELLQFLEMERKLRRRSLIMPLYFITCLDLEDRQRQKNDELMLEIGRRQRADWRDLRNEPSDYIVSKHVEQWAIDVRDALEAYCEDRRGPLVAGPREPQRAGPVPPDLVDPGLTADQKPPEKPNSESPAGADLRDHDFFVFVKRTFVDLICDQGPVFRDSLFSKVDLCELTREDIFGDGALVTESGYLWWERRISYFLHALRNGCEDVIISQTSNVIDPAMLPVALRHMEFGLKVNDRHQRGQLLIDWDIRSATKPELATEYAQHLLQHGSISNRVIDRKREITYRIAYGGGVAGDHTLDVSLRIPWVLGTRAVFVRGHEKQLLRRDENFYHMNIRHPTRGIRSQMQLGQGLRAWRVLESTLAPDKYPKERPTEGIGLDPVEDVSETRHPYLSDVELPDWVLPGIALLLEWRYPMTDRLFTADRKRCGDPGG